MMRSQVSWWLIIKNLVSCNTCFLIFNKGYFKIKTYAGEYQKLT